MITKSIGSSHAGISQQQLAEGGSNARNTIDIRDESVALEASRPSVLDKRQQRRVYQDPEGGGSFEAEYQHP